MKRKISVGVIFGGRSGEHEVSLASATTVINSLDRKKYSVVPLGITKKGEWFTGSNTLSLFKKGKTSGLEPVTFNVNAQNPRLITLKNKKSVRLDVVFPILHGPYGEDGTIQGMFELMDLPYVGFGVAASSVGMNKLMAKLIFKAQAIPQAEFISLSRTEFLKNKTSSHTMILKKIGLPCFVKPNNLGSSVGITKVKKASTLLNALRLAAQYDETILVEKAIDAREFACAVLGNDAPQASTVLEIKPKREFYDFYAKYVDDDTELVIPATLPATDIKRVQQLSLQAFKAVQGAGMARVDFLMDRTTREFFIIEINSIPGFTSHSMYPRLWAHAGIPHGALVDRLITLAFERNREKKKNKILFESGSDWFQ